MNSPALAAEARPAAPSLGAALGYWLKLGCISFGGPAGQIALMHQELVERRRWISERRFLHALNYCMLLPGPEAQQLATYIGWLLHGAIGGIAAGGLFVLPSLLLLIALSWIYSVHGDVPWVAAILYGIKPAVVAIVAHAAYRIGSRTLKNNVLRLLAATAFIASSVLHLPFPLLVLGAAVSGALGVLIAPTQFQPGGKPAAHAASYGPALIDDDTPAPAHARFACPHAIAVAVLGLALWVAVLVLVGTVAGWQGTLSQMLLFFSKAALLTFGGAYAVLPYVVQGAVEHHHWLTTAQMMDGLALGETTPGPLIMVVAFVGFAGAWSHQVFGPEALPLAGAAGAGVATFGTFLPSFLFILVGGPLVEATRQELRFTAPLTAVTAAIVGVILNLAVFLGYHAFWPQGLVAGVDPLAVLIGGVVFLGLTRFRLGVVTVIAGAALAGLLRLLLI